MSSITATTSTNQSNLPTASPSPSVVLSNNHDVPRQDHISSARPQVRSIPTSDRLRENTLLTPLILKMSGKIPKGRQSVFREVGLIDDASLPPAPPPHSPPPLDLAHASAPQLGQESSGRRAESGDAEVIRSNYIQQDNSSNSSSGSSENTYKESSSTHQRHHQRQNSAPVQSWYAKLTRQGGRPRVRSASGAPPQAISGTYRFALIAILVAVVFPALSFHRQTTSMDLHGADAGVIMKRETSPTEVCTRWAHQSANVNGTLYIYGGQATAEQGQEQNTWNNKFLTLDLNTDWSTDSPALKGLERPDGPPPVAMGYLWQDYNNLYLYGGQFADNPYVDPWPESLWRYSIDDEEWKEFPDPKTSEGNFSEPANQPVQRAAEGAGISVPELGLSWYFGGHLDRATTPGWSMHTERVYLNSLLEFTHPGYTNTAIKDLSQGGGAADGGVYRNITTAGVQAEDFPDRADAALIFVPGWGDMGVLIGIGGGTADTFTNDPQVLDVYDIAHSDWYRQETKGEAPSVRVNPCAVVASAPDASSFQIYLFGGQNLQPFKDQTQYDDMYILTIPAFTWIKVKAGDGTPSPRAGHTCTMQDGQMIVVGGYVGDGPCDSPGIYVFDASELKWKDQFMAGNHPPGLHPDNSVLAGSYGYTVPGLVQDVIGGGEDGGATATTPAVGAPSDGPFATGKPPVFTITQSGATTTITPTAQPDGPGVNGESNDGGRPVGGLVAAGVIAGVAGALALYLGFCAWLYRRQVSAYRQHLAVAKRYSNTPGGSAAMLQASQHQHQHQHRPGSMLVGNLFGGFGRRPRQSVDGESDNEAFAWVGSDREPSWLSEPKWTSDDPSTGIEGTGSTLPSGSASKRSGEASGFDDRRHSGSGESADGLLEGQEPSFFNVVMGPRRALRVVNGMD